MPEFATENQPMEPTTPASRGLVAWVVILVIAFLGGGMLVVYQRDRTSRPTKGARDSGETSIPDVSLEDLARDFRKPARERRFKGQFVEVTGFVASAKRAPGNEKGKTILLVCLAPDRGQEALVCCACPTDRGLPAVRPGEGIVVQGTVDVILSEGPIQAGLVDARIVRRLSE